MYIQTGGGGGVFGMISTKKKNALAVYDKERAGCMKHYITRKGTQLFDGKEKWIFPRMKKSSVRKGKKDIGLEQKEPFFFFFFFF